jgi:hypothetical protein
MGAAGGNERGGVILFGQGLVIVLHEVAGFFLGGDFGGGPLVGAGGDFFELGAELVHEAVGVTAPIGVEIALGVVKYGDVEGDAEFKLEAISAVGGVDVIKEEAVESGLVPADAFSGMAFEGEKEAVKGLHVAHAAAKTTGEADGDSAMTGLGKQAGAVGDAGGVPAGAGELGGADDADDIEAFEVAAEAGEEIGGPDFDIIMGKYDDVALGKRQAAVIAIADAFGVMDADDLVFFIFEEIVVTGANILEERGLYAANDYRDHHLSLSLVPIQTRRGGVLAAMWILKTSSRCIRVERSLCRFVAFDASE